MSTRQTSQRPHLSHDAMVEKVYDRLKERGRYHFLQHHLLYNRRGVCGEFDVLAVNGRRAHMYEIKTFDLVKSRQKFFAQAARVKFAFPEYKWTFVYVTNDTMLHYPARNILPYEVL